MQPQRGSRPFAHPSEAEFARILDFNGVQWEYEPRTFALRGEGVEPERGFTPDFYLPELDLWVELTTLRRSLMRQKRRKVRDFASRYPHVRLKLLGAHDLLSLMVKYGRTAASTVGAAGSNTPPRRRAARRAARSVAGRSSQSIAA
ncbi:MAG: hypothetical protein ACR2JL_00680 [Candidatus Limnocylindrus sp.]